MNWKHPTYTYFRPIEICFGRVVVLGVAVLRVAGVVVVVVVVAVVAVVVDVVVVVVVGATVTATPASGGVLDLTDVLIPEKLKWQLAILLDPIDVVSGHNENVIETHICPTDRVM